MAQFSLSDLQRARNAITTGIQQRANMADSDPRAPQAVNLSIVQTLQEQPVALERQLAASLRLSNLLHSSLDVNEVLNLFVAAVRRELKISGAIYRNDSFGLVVEFDVAASHACTYRLDYQKSALGELSLSRDRRFSERELQRLESMLGSLVPALRNALQYLGAIQTATRDALTGAGNRIALEVAADREIALSRRSGQPVSILVIDIDHFKDVNDRYGHNAGDRVLIDIARQLRQSCRESDSIFRFGGEEFVILLSQTEENGALAIAERIRGAIAGMGIHYQQQLIHITASIGIACLDRNESLHTWFDRADRALYLAKQAGRNRVVRAAHRHIA